MSNPKPNNNTPKPHPEDMSKWSKEDFHNQHSNQSNVCPESPSGKTHAYAINGTNCLMCGTGRKSEPVTELKKHITPIKEYPEPVSEEKLYEDFAKLDPMSNNQDLEERIKNILWAWSWAEESHGLEYPDSEPNLMNLIPAIEQLILQEKIAELECLRVNPYAAIDIEGRRQPLEEKMIPVSQIDARIQALKGTIEQ